MTQVQILLGYILEIINRLRTVIQRGDRKLDIFVMSAKNWPHVRWPSKNNSYFNRKILSLIVDLIHQMF
jgi:hypothetical protein